jgi:hypothetical protein
MDGNSSGSCPQVGFGISSIEPLVLPLLFIWGLVDGFFLSLPQYGQCTHMHAHSLLDPSFSHKKALHLLKSHSLTLSPSLSSTRQFLQSVGTLMQK